MMKKIINAFFYILLSTCLVASVQADVLITYYHNDLLGSPVAATDENGTLLWQEEYMPFGERVEKDPKSLNNRQWHTGKPLDEATGLTYLGARYCDSKIGRFMAVDPVGFGESSFHSFNRYALVNNNPQKFIDPNGEAGFLALIPPTLKLLGVGVTGFAIGSNISDVARGEKTAGEAAKDGVIEAGAGIILGGTGKLLTKIGGPFIDDVGKKITAGGGADIDNLSEAERNAIQLFVSETDSSVTLVGSRAAKQGGNSIDSDFDFIIEPINRKIRKKAKSKLPKGQGGGEIGTRGPTGQDFLDGPVDTNKPFIKFDP